MTDSHRENLSAGMDGELTGEELRFLLRRVDHDAALQRAWSRYHLARDGLRRQVAPLASADFASRVLQAIEQESGVAVGGQGRRRSWLRWSAGGAIAASVAVAALMVTQPVGPGGEASTTPQVASAAPDPSTAGQGMVVAAPAPAAAPPWLNRYSGLPSQLTQQASATVDSGDTTYLYGRSASNPYQVERYRAINNGDGSYLLLLHPEQHPDQKGQSSARQASGNR